MLSSVLRLCKVRALTSVNNTHKTVVNEGDPHSGQLIVLYFYIPVMDIYKTTLFQKKNFFKPVSRLVGIEMKLGCLGFFFFFLISVFVIVLFFVSFYGYTCGI